MHSDNTGAECCLRKGTAKHQDHCRLVNDVWKHALQKQMQLYIQRVATDDNWADSPSRFMYGALEIVGAIKCEPRLAKYYAARDAEALCAEFV